MPRTTAHRPTRAAVIPTSDGTPQSEPAASVLRKFRQVFNAVKTHFQQVEKRAGVGGAQVWALSIIRSQAEIGVSSLAKAMDIHQTTASNLVKAMVNGGLVVSTRSRHDRRSTHLALTPAGQRVLMKAPSPFSGVLPQALAELDIEALEQLDCALAKLLERLDANQRAGGIPLANM